MEPASACYRPNTTAVLTDWLIEDCKEAARPKELPDGEYLYTNLPARCRHAGCCKCQEGGKMIACDFCPMYECFECALGNKYQTTYPTRELFACYDCQQCYVAAHDPFSDTNT